MFEWHCQDCECAQLAYGKTESSFRIRPAKVLFQFLAVLGYNLYALLGF